MEVHQMTDTVIPTIDTDFVPPTESLEFEELPPLDYDAIYPHPLDEHMNIVWSAEKLVEIAAANKPVLAANARFERDAKLTEYDKLVSIETRKTRTSGLTGEQLTNIYDHIGRLDDYAALLMAVPDQSGFPEVVEWPDLPTQ
jgi:hypothetical protein